MQETFLKHEIYYIKHDTGFVVLITLITFFKDAFNSLSLAPIQCT